MYLWFHDKTFLLVLLWHDPWLEPYAVMLMQLDLKTQVMILHLWTSCSSAILFQTIFLSQTAKVGISPHWWSLVINHIFPFGPFFCRVLIKHLFLHHQNIILSLVACLARLHGKFHVSSHTIGLASGHNLVFFPPNLNEQEVSLLFHYLWGFDWTIIVGKVRCWTYDEITSHQIEYMFTLILKKERTSCN